MNPEPDPAAIFHLERPGPALWKLYLIRSVLSGPAIDFRGINNAEEVKQLIATRMRGQRDAGLGDRDDVPSPAATPPGATAALEAVLAEARALRLALEKRRDASGGT